jgi:chitin disaccharide deacetylase
MPVQLVVNADDFGFTRDVNAGIIEAHTRGILTATTLMANGGAFEEAVRLAREHPKLDIGCHLVLVQGPSLLTKGRALPGSIPELLRALTLRRLDPYAELKPQIERISDAGLRPLHLDTHKHTHLWPPVLDAVARLSEEFGIPWVRRPFDLPLVAGDVPLSKRLVSRAVGSLRHRFHRKLAYTGAERPIISPDFR